MSLLHDAIKSAIPTNARPTPYEGAVRYKINCPLCHLKGHRRDTQQRGAFFLSHDGHTGYSCFQCQTDTRQAPDKSLTAKMKEVLLATGMSSEAVERLSYDLWAAKIAREQGIAPRPYIEQKPLPDGAKTIGHWIATNIADPNFNDLLEDLADMSEERRDTLYWTPNPGTSGDMNRRYIWAIGSVGWAAHLIGEDPEPLLSDPNIMTYKDDE